MDQQHKSDWVVPVLNDVATFLSANGMHRGYGALRAAIMVVQDDVRTNPDSSLRIQASVSGAIREGNVVCFSVVSRQPS